MILKLFKNQRPATLGLLILLAIGLWSFSFMKGGVDSDTLDYSIYYWILNLINGIPFIKPIGALILVVIQANMINNIVIENQLISTRTYVPSLAYIVLISSTPELLTSYSGIIGNFFFILMLNRLFSSYREEQSTAKIFDAGLYVGLASTVHFSFIFMLLFCWLSLATLRSFSWREILVVTIGAIVPYTFIATYYYAFGNFADLAAHFMLFENNISYSEIIVPVHYYPLLISFIILLLLAATTVFHEWRIGTAKVKKLLTTLTLFSIFSLLSPLLFSGLNISFYSALAIPLCVYCSSYFINSQKKIIVEISFLLLLISIVYLHIVTL